jgi:uncharacterized protein
LEAGRFDLICSNFLLDEYVRALSDERIIKRHHLSREQVQTEVDRLRQLAIVVAPEDVPSVIAADPDDDNVLACAVSGRAGYIVSGDAHLLNLRSHQDIRILSPAAFVLMLEVD